MSLDATQQRKCFKYIAPLQFDQSELFVDGVDIAAAIAAVDDASKEQTVAEILAILDDLYGKLSPAEVNFALLEACKGIKFNPNEWCLRITQFEWFVIQLCAVIGGILQPTRNWFASSDPPRCLR